jgi:hypothetical protein
MAANHGVLGLVGGLREPGETNNPSVRAGASRRMGVQIFAAQKHGPTGTITVMKACGTRRNEVVMGIYNKYGPS